MYKGYLQINFMKIISGALKGRKLKISSAQAKNENMRPTTGYTKNLLYNLLAQNNIVQRDLNGIKVLDCFCGTGAVGLEFASRGAEYVSFVDSDEINIAQIHKNAEILGINYSARVGFFPRCKIKEEFDIIFVDPPYIAAQSQILKTLQSLQEYSLAENGIIILELPNDKHSSIVQNIAKIMAIILQKEISGATILLFLQKSKITI